MQDIFESPKKDIRQVDGYTHMVISLDNFNSIINNRIRKND